MSRTRHTVYLGLARVVGIAVQVLSIPIVWDILGEEKFGLCYFLIALGRWVSLVDIGYADGAQRLMTRAFDSDDKPAGFATFYTFLWLIIGHALVGFGLFVLLGAIVPLPSVVSAFVAWPLFIAGAGCFAAQYLQQNISVYFNASRQFNYLALANGSQFLVSGLVALFLTLIYKTPEAYLSGFAIGYGLVFLLHLMRSLLQARSAGAGPQFSKESFKSCFAFGAKLYLTKVSSVTIGTIDRIAITNVLGPAQLTPYANAARIPEAASEAIPLNQTLLPDYTRAAIKGGKEFAELVDYGSRISLMVGCGLIFVPSAFGAPVLQLWLQDKYVPEMGAIMVLIGLFRAFETYYGGLAQVLLAHGSPQKVALLTMINAALLLALTYPSVWLGGIVGVAVLRSAIHIVQLVPVTWYVQKSVVPEIAFSNWLGRLAGILGLAGVIAWLGYWSSHTALFASMPWLALLAAPVAMVAYFYLTDKWGLAPVPDGIKRRIRNLARWREPAS